MIRSRFIRKKIEFEGTMVNLFVGIRQAPPLVDKFIVPEVPGVLYALFDYGLTKNSTISQGYLGI